MQKMKFGLNLSSKKSAKPTFNRHNTFSRPQGNEDEEEEGSDAEQPSDKKSFRANVNQQLAAPSKLSKKIAEEHAKALEEDATIFDYDAVYDDLKLAERKKKEALKSADTKKAKYIHGLLEMAEIRKRDRLLAEEKKVAREREAEGEEFADKDVFMTEAFKKQKAELERIEAEERKREEEAARKRTMTSFYKEVLDRKEREYATIMEALKTTKASDKSLTEEQRTEILDAKLAEEARREGKNVVLNDNNEIVDRRQLLGAGLNLKPKFGTLASLASTDERIRERHLEYEEYKRKKVAEYEARLRSGRDSEREKFSREVERQMMETREKEKQEEEQKLRELEQKATAKRTTEEAAMSARERYLARKKQKLAESK